MRALLIDTVHETWLPAGTIGEVYIDDEGYTRFRPKNPVEGYGLPSAAYIGTKRYKPLDAKATL